MSIYTPPESMWIVLGASLLISIITGAVNRLVLPVAKIRRYSREVKKFREAMANAKKENNQKLILKLERKKKFIDRITREQASSRFRPMLIYLIPFMALFYYLNSLYSAAGISSVAVVLPINLSRIPFIPEGMLGGAPFWFGGYVFAISPTIQAVLSVFALLNHILLPGATVTWSLIPGFGVYFWWWYLITNFAFAGIFQRLFGVNFET
nr:EMC3/TMCO1 family protein [Candidatus Freyarchaeota archaeon]